MIDTRPQITIQRHRKQNDAIKNKNTCLAKNMSVTNSTESHFNMFQILGRELYMKWLKVNGEYKVPCKRFNLN